MDPTPFLGGQRSAIPADTLIPISADLEGNWLSEGFPGGGGYMTMYAQAFVADAGLPAGVAISNALQVEFLP